MAKSSGLAVLALLIAVGALGLGVYQMFSAVPGDEGSGIKNTWDKSHYSPLYTNPTGTLLPVSQLTINFTVSSGEHVYFYFNTWAVVYAGVNSYIEFHFMLDGALLSSPPYPWWVFRTFGDRIESPISCQLSHDNVTAGAHYVTISISGSDVNNNIRSSTLIVQTYIP